MSLPEGALTPDVIGPMPPGLPMFDETRAMFAYEVLRETVEPGTVLAREAVTGEKFYLTLNADCGAGCHCAAEIRWTGRP